MDRIDEFESMFRRADRESFRYVDIAIKSVALVTSGDRAGAEQQADEIRAFFPRLASITDWRLVTRGEYHNVRGLLDLFAASRPDLIVTHRCLQQEDLIPQHSLGVYLDVLTQATDIPVLVMPGTAAQPISLADRKCMEVMVVTDHISGDSRLINHGVRMCSLSGTVYFCHIEDDLVFERYMRAIEKIPGIDTEMARKEIDFQLLKEASDFIETCMATLRENVVDISFQSTVMRGHRLQEYEKLLRAHEVDLLISNTKDETQLAMHGMAYSLAVQFQEAPMLLL